MGLGGVDALAAAAAPVEADVELEELRRADAEIAAVPDDLLEAHAARERLRLAGLVGSEQEQDQPLRCGCVGRPGGVEVPVQRAALGVQRGLVLAPLLAAVRAPRGAAGVRS